MKPISLSIPKPCHETWEAMTSEDKGRFCDACQKTVIDFTVMSDREVAQFFKRPVDSVCGRFDGSQLNRIVEVPRKRLPWIKYFFTIAMPAFLFSKKGAAQGEVSRGAGKADVCNKSLPATSTMARLKNLKSDTVQAEPLWMGFVSSKIKVVVPKIFKSQVKNGNGEAVPFASVMAKEEGRVVIADSTGTFSIKYLKLPLTLQISSVGYQRRNVLYNGEENVAIVLQPAYSSEVTPGIVAVACVRKKKATREVIVPKKAEAPVTTFSVYPNPVSPNTSFAIDAKDLENGNYTMQLLNISGALMLTKELMLETKATPVIALGPVAAGSYFVRLTNRKNNKNVTEVLLVR